MQPWIGKPISAFTLLRGGLGEELSFFIVHNLHGSVEFTSRYFQFKFAKRPCFLPARPCFLPVGPFWVWTTTWKLWIILLCRSCFGTSTFQILLTNCPKQYVFYLKSICFLPAGVSDGCPEGCVLIFRHVIHGNFGRVLRLLVCMFPSWAIFVCPKHYVFNPQDSAF